GQRVAAQHGPHRAGPLRRRDPGRRAPYRSRRDSPRDPAARRPTPGSGTVMTALGHEPAVLTEGLRKHYPGRGAALDGLDLTVATGAVHGLLGPNGAGKTTAVRILATLVRFDSGHVRVAGHDVARDPAGVRASIALAGQHAA